MQGNKECVDTVLVDDEVKKKFEEELDLKVLTAKDNEEGGTAMNRLQKGVSLLLDKQNKKEEAYEKETEEAINEQQQKAFS